MWIVNASSSKHYYPGEPVNYAVFLCWENRLFGFFVSHASLRSIREALEWGGMLLRNDHQQPCSGGGGWRKFIALIAQTAAAFRLPIALALLYLTLRYALYNQWFFSIFSTQPRPIFRSRFGDDFSMMGWFCSIFGTKIPWGFFGNATFTTFLYVRKNEV